MKKNTEGKKPTKKVVHDHPFLKRLHGWLDAVEAHAAKTETPVEVTE